MHDREAMILAARDLSIMPDLRRRISGVDLTGCSGEFPALVEGPQYWCFVDWLLPEISGLEMCRRLRETPATRNAHITMLIDEDDSQTKQRALKGGADDYLIGPLDAGRLAERLEQYRKMQSKAPPAARVTQGELQVDLAAVLVRYRDKRIALAPNEFRLLSHFVQNPDRVYSRTALIGILGKQSVAIDERTVDVWIGRLRKALDAQGVPDRLRTVRAMGYVYDGV